MSFMEAYAIPIALRKWWIKRTEAQIKEEIEAQKKAQQIK